MVQASELHQRRAGNAKPESLHMARTRGARIRLSRRQVEVQRTRWNEALVTQVDPKQTLACADEEANTSRSEHGASFADISARAKTVRRRSFGP